ncbi:hypothetical protein E2C01_048561 [Portunus trituberculatus]|uniref:Uncharacterized protein n=1 Tax=Portunus trituberculatus TaxID=210409 RepID=A0A5B7GBZ3_PORTR|nr:hypothetical protein [Portunus trituberculatus]
MQECHPRGGFACHILQVMGEEKFGVHLHPKDVDRVRDAPVGLLEEYEKSCSASTHYQHRTRCLFGVNTMQVPHHCILTDRQAVQGLVTLLGEMW